MTTICRANYEIFLINHRLKILIPTTTKKMNVERERNDKEEDQTQCVDSEKNKPLSLNIKLTAQLRI